MQKPIYPVRQSTDALTFEFFSEGPKGNVRKRVVFQPTDNPYLYNFAFGDVDEANHIDDLAETNNGDIALVMATVANALFAFFEQHPNCFVFLEGSTNQRNRLYQRIIQRYGPELNNKMWFRAGLKVDELSYLSPEPINPVIQYSYFLIGLY
jgi:hypothetical protein